MLVQLLHGDAVIFVHLKTLDHKEASLDADGLIETDHVAAIVDFRNQVLHLEAVEGSQADEHLVKHHAQGPRINLLTVATLLQQLGARVEWSAADAQVCIGPI